MEIRRSTDVQPGPGGVPKPDWLDQIVEGLYTRLAQGEKPALPPPWVGCIIGT